MYLDGDDVVHEAGLAAGPVGVDAQTAQRVQRVVAVAAPALVAASARLRPDRPPTTPKKSFTHTSRPHTHPFLAKNRTLSRNRYIPYDAILSLRNNENSSAYGKPKVDSIPELTVTDAGLKERCHQRISVQADKEFEFL